MHTLNSIHELALRLLYNDYELPFDRILEKIKQKSMNQNHIESLAIEIYKFQGDLTSPIISNLFVVRVNKDNIEISKHYNLQMNEQ